MGSYATTDYFHILSSSSFILIQPFDAIQNVPGGKVTILGSHSIGHSKQKSIYIYVCVLFGTVSEISALMLPVEFSKVYSTR
jgi:hypothetical protein